MSTVANAGAIDVHELVHDLVSIPSPSGEEEAMAQYLVEFFERHEREVWLDDIGNVRAPADEVVLLTSHMDTVTGMPPVKLSEVEDGRTLLYGRGSVDAKGALAAMAVTSISKDVSFAGVVREETDSAGAEHLVADRDEPANVINGEPSGGDGIILGYRGIQSGTYYVTTPRAHPSRQEPNAIDHVTTWWSTVAGRYATSGSPFETVTVTPRSIKGGVDADGVALEATLDFDLRVPPSVSVQSLRETLESLDDHGTIDWGHFVPPQHGDPQTPLAAALRWAIRSAGGEPHHLLKGGTSDANVYAAGWSCPVVTYGPGDASLDHTPGEYLPLSELDRAVTTLEYAVDHLRGETS